ncbi:MAG: glutamate 5-kinase [Candidatus Glassbacteria bacterium]|nr:glutamate 5-kinase [Candidatus Glassbacteria bacterium]
MNRKNYLKEIDRVVIKVGTRVLTGADNLIDPGRIERLAAEVVALCQRRTTVILVSSGAVGAGMGRLGLAQYPKLIPDRQAVAAVGQVGLMKMWQQAFSGHGFRVGQVLLTAEDFQNRRRYVNLQNTFESLFRLGVVPVVNENDSVAVRELRYGDNDTLSSQVATVVDAGMLVILTDIDGFYTGKPGRDDGAERLSIVERVSPEMVRSTRGKGSEVSIGGMRTKLEAARLATAAGRFCVIASGLVHSLEGIMDGEDLGTLFLPLAEGMKRRKQWIAFSGRSRGKVLVDEGARRALLERGVSLLASGIRETIGDFDSGDIVDIATSGQDEPFARGVTSYSAEDLGRIKGLHSSRIEQVLGHRGSEEVIHKDNLALVEKIVSRD